MIVKGDCCMVMASSRIMFLFVRFAGLASLSIYFWTFDIHLQLKNPEKLVLCRSMGIAMSEYERPFILDSSIWLFSSFASRGAGDILRWLFESHCFNQRSSFCKNFFRRRNPWSFIIYRQWRSLFCFEWNFCHMRQTMALDIG